MVTVGEMIDIIRDKELDEWVVTREEASDIVRDFILEITQSLWLTLDKKRKEGYTIDLSGGDDEMGC